MYKNKYICFKLMNYKQILKIQWTFIYSYTFIYILLCNCIFFFYGNFFSKIKMRIFDKIFIY